MQVKDREIALLQQQLRQKVKSVTFISQNMTKSLSYVQETELVQDKDRVTLLQQQLNNVSDE